MVNGQDVNLDLRVRIKKPPDQKSYVYGHYVAKDLREVYVAMAAYKGLLGTVVSVDGMSVCKN